LSRLSRCYSENPAADTAKRKDHTIVALRIPRLAIPYNRSSAIENRCLNLAADVQFVICEARQNFAAKMDRGPI
jgi:tRNA(Leu) C34 or U34 (ribose-2'-O)-methylase TrmL